MSEKVLNSLLIQTPTPDHQLGCVCGGNTFVHCKLEEVDLYAWAGLWGIIIDHMAKGESAPLLLPKIQLKRVKRCVWLCAFGSDCHIMHAYAVSGLLLC